MQYKMTYPEFLKAAIKHKLTCDHIRQAIETIDNQEQIRSLTLNLYYLSGYIIECAIKYAIYQTKATTRMQSIEHIRQAQDKDFKHNMFAHKFSFYRDYLDPSFSGIVPIDEQPSISTSVIVLYDNWDAEVRYYYDAMPKELKGIITYQNVKAFNDHAQSILHSIKTKSLGK